MTILDKIIETKKIEVANQKKVIDTETLKKHPDFNRKCNSFKIESFKGKCFRNYC